LPAHDLVRRALTTGCLLLAPGLAEAAELSGRIGLISERSGRPARGVNLTETIVAFVPAGQATPNAPKEPYVMATVRKSFEPASLVVQTGSSVIFPNFDPILHNVFSLTPESPFDLGLYGKGEGKTVVFGSSGLIRVFCNVHQDMYAHILVVDTPHYTRAKADGSFALRDLPQRAGRLLLWHPRANLETVQSVAPGRGLSFSLAVKRRKVPSHVNKLGKPYGKRRSRYGG